MKNKHILYTVCILVIVSIAAVFIMHTTGQTPDVIATASTVPTDITQVATNTTMVLKKKDCQCCEDRLAKFKEHLKKQRGQQKTSENTEVASE